jgi:hypothetical protein
LRIQISHGFKKLVPVCHGNPRVSQLHEKEANVFVGRLVRAGRAFCSFLPSVLNCRAHRESRYSKNEIKRLIIGGRRASVCPLPDL